MPIKQCIILLSHASCETWFYCAVGNSSIFIWSHWGVCKALWRCTNGHVKPFLYGYVIGILFAILPS